MNDGIKPTHEAGNAEPVHPFSLPLEKGGEQAEHTPPEEKAAPAQTPPRPVHPAHRTGFVWWQVFLAMLLFPLLFHAGSEIYMFARVGMVSYLGMGGASSQQTGQVPGITGGTEGKILESLSSIILNQQKMMEEGTQRVVIIRPEYPGAFSFENEKNRIFQLSGMDLDDPIGGAEKFKGVNSVEVLTALIESFDRITLNAATSNLSEFHLKNSIEGKRQAVKRLQELK